MKAKRLVKPLHAIPMAIACILSFHQTPARADGIAIVGSGDNGRVELFYERSGTSPGIYHAYQTTPGLTGGFHPWVNMSATANNPAVIVAERDHAGRIIVGWLDKNSIVVSQAAVAGGAMPTPVKLTVNAKPLPAERLRSLAIAIDADGRSEFFALSDRGEVWSVAQKSAGSWAALNTHNLGGARGLARIAATPYRDGRLALVAVEPSGSVSWRSQIGPNDGWGPWADLKGSGLKEIAAKANQNGTLQLVAIGSDGKLYQLRQNADWSWPSWTVLPTGQAGGFTAPLVLAQNTDGRLEVFAKSSSLVDVWQLQANGAWSTGVLGDIAYSGGDFAVATLPSGPLVAASTDAVDCLSDSFYQTQATGPAANWPLMAGPPGAGSFCPPTMQVTSLFANPNPLAAGKPSTINWNFKSNFSCAPIDLALTGNGAPIFNKPATGSFFSQALSPTVTTNYQFTATCHGTSVSSSKSLTLNVVQAPPSVANVIFANGPFYTPSDPVTNSPFTAQIIFQNVGNAKSPAYTLELSIDDGLGGAHVFIGTQPIATMAAGAPTTVNFPVPAQSLDSFNLDFVIKETGQSESYSLVTY